MVQQGTQRGLDSLHRCCPSHRLHGARLVEAGIVLGHCGQVLGVRVVVGGSDHCVCLTCLVEPCILGLIPCSAGPDAALPHAEGRPALDRAGSVVHDVFEGRCSPHVLRYLLLGALSLLLPLSAVLALASVLLVACLLLELGCPLALVPSAALRVLCSALAVLIVRDLLLLALGAP